MLLALASTGIMLTAIQLATPFVVMCYVLPAIIHRFESYLISLEACKVLDLKVSPALALEALTKDSDNSEEHGEEKINFKSGMGPNYERYAI
jgi:endoribonuclease Dicer